MFLFLSRVNTRVKRRNRILESLLCLLDIKRERVTLKQNSILNLAPNWSKNRTVLTKSWLCWCTCAGEFGSVREALLKTDNSSVQKVAVKVLKCEWFFFFCGLSWSCQHLKQLRCRFKIFTYENSESGWTDILNSLKSKFDCFYQTLRLLTHQLSSYVHNQRGCWGVRTESRSTDRNKNSWSAYTVSSWIVSERVEVSVEK